MDPSDIGEWYYEIIPALTDSDIGEWYYEIIEDTNCPIDYVTWYDSAMFCNLLSIKEGLNPYYTFTNIVKDGNNIISANVIENNNNKGWRGYRLPTITEWKYCAKKGSTSTIYSGSNTLTDVAWYVENSLSTYSTIPFPMFHPVGTKNHNALGFYDMTGNMFEWLDDGTIIGGSFNSTASECLLTYTETKPKSTRAKNISFRPVKTI